MPRFHKKLLFAAAVQALTICPAPAETPSSNSLHVICSAAVEWCDLLAEKYQAKFKVSVVVTHLATNSALEKIRQEKAGGKFDVWFGGTGDPHLEAAEEELTIQYKSKHLSDLRDWASRQAAISKYHTVGLYSGMLGFIVNDAALKRRNIKVPRCWFDLLRPAYKDLIGAPNPVTSGTGYTMIATLVSMMGEDTAYSYMKRVGPSVHEYVKSGTQLAPMVAKGEVPIAIGFIHDGVREKQKGAPISVVWPCEGSGYETGSVSIIRGGDVTESKRFVDWVLSPDAQAYAAEAKQFQIPSNQKTPIPQGTPRFSEFMIYLAYDPRKFAAPAEKKRLTERWQREIFVASPSSK